MSLASLIGQQVVRLMVHQRMSLSQHGGGGPLECFGAVALWFKDTVLVLRSPLRYSNPRLADLIKGANACGPTVSLCSHEEAQWLMESIGPAWRDHSTRGARLTAISATATALWLDMGPVGNRWLTYRDDLDACWLYSKAAVCQEVSGINLLGPDAAFGWLLPESEYGLNWDGRDWSTLAAAWACSGSHAQEGARDRLFQELYCLRLRQHPNLLRRFAALSYPLTCGSWPWLATQIEKIRQRAISDLPGQIPRYQPPDFSDG